MASGRIHKTLTLMGAAACAAIPDPLIAAGVAAGFLFSLECHPDCDQEQHMPLRWKPYAKLFRHRGVSHWPLIGTLTRLAYILSPPVTLWVAVELAIWWHGIVFPRLVLPLWVGQFIVAVFVGLCLSDLLHWVADRKLFTHFKRRGRATRKHPTLRTNTNRRQYEHQ